MLEEKSALPMSPLKGSSATHNGSTMAVTHLELNKARTSIVGMSPSCSIQFSHPNVHLEERKSSLQNTLQINGGGGAVLVTHNPLRPDSLKVEHSNGAFDSRRGSGISACSVNSECDRRSLRSFIRFPSIRRHSEASKGKGVKRTDRTSKMLIAVLLLFLLTEFPQGIMHFLTGWYGPEFLRCKYNPWGEIWDIVALINSGINFILYCFMSKQFRTQFKISFAKLCKCLERPKWVVVNCKTQPAVSTTV